MWPALAILAGSILLKNKANRDAQKQQESIRRSMEAFQRTKSAESMAATEELLKKQTPQARAEEMAQLTAERTGSLRDTVAAAASPAPQIAGKLSPDYERSQEAAANSIAEKTRRAIQQMATMGAPSEQQNKFAKRFGLAAGKVDASNIASRNVGSAYLNDINNVRPDPMMHLLGDAGLAVGSGMFGGGGFSASGLPNTDPTVFADSGETTGGATDWKSRLRRSFGLLG